MKQKYEIQDCHILPSIYGPSRRIIESPHIISNNYENSLIDRIC